LSLTVVRTRLPRFTLQSHFLHQPRHRAAGHVVSIPQQLSPDVAHTVDLEVLIETLLL